MTTGSDLLNDSTMITTLADLLTVVVIFVMRNNLQLDIRKLNLIFQEDVS
jgi:hypothetical protein